MVSKAALRSKSTNMAPPSESTAWSMSFCTRRRAVSVLWSCLYADWNISYKSFSLRWSTNCSQTIRSISLETKDKLETGRKFLKISQSRINFLIRGVTKALFNSGVKSAHDNDVLTITVRTGAAWSRHCFNNHVGIGSRAQDFVGDYVITFLTSDSETTLNCSRDNPLNMGAVDGNWSVDVFKDSLRLLRINSILFLK